MTTWTAPDIDRGGLPSVGADEHAALAHFLDFHRKTLLLKCAGLTGEQLASKPVATSALSLLGLVRHLAENDRWWFRRIAGQDETIAPLYCTDEFPDGDFDLAVAEGAEADFATFAEEREQVRRWVAGRSLDEEFPEGEGKPNLTLRWVCLHMMEEYARHNGHADLLREAIDGATGE